MLCLFIFNLIYFLILHSGKGRNISAKWHLSKDWKYGSLVELDRSPPDKESRLVCSL